MARTQISGSLIENSSVGRSDINTSTSGEALITKVLVNSPLTISSTGVNSGTGDVTLGLSTSNLVTSFNTRTGAVILTGSDVTTALGFTPTSGNQTITLSGDVTGSGATAITTTIGNGAVTNAKLENSSITIGTTSISLGSTSAGLVGLSGGTGQTGAGTTQTFRVGSGGIAVGGDSYFANSVGVNQNVLVTGNAGIGTAAPSSKLQLGEDASTLGSNVLAMYRGGSTGQYTTIENEGGTVYKSYGVGGHVFYHDPPQEAMRVAATTGNLLVGTSTDAGYRLDVQGGDARFAQNVEAATYSVAGIPGWSGTVICPSNPPGQQNLEFLQGILINVF